MNKDTYIVDKTGVYKLMKHYGDKWVSIIDVNLDTPKRQFTVRVITTE